MDSKQQINHIRYTKIDKYFNCYGYNPLCVVMRSFLRQIQKYKSGSQCTPDYVYSTQLKQNKNGLFFESFKISICTYISIIIMSVCLELPRWESRREINMPLAGSNKKPDLAGGFQPGITPPLATTS